jgi:hypothetical protein
MKGVQRVIIAANQFPSLPKKIGPWMDTSARRALSRPVAALAAQPESLKEVAEFKTIAQNLLSHEEVPFWLDGGGLGRVGGRQVLAAPP